MLSILIVDDDTAKSRAIIKFIYDHKLGAKPRVETATDGNSARRMLRSQRFDLLILDVVLPDTADGDPEVDGGLSILDDLACDDAYSRPAIVLGVSANPAAFEPAKEVFGENNFAFVEYSAESSDWEGAVSTALSKAEWAARSEECAVGHRTDVAILCAIDMEAQAVLNNGWNWSRLKTPDDICSYYRACPSIRGVVRTVTLAVSNEMGMVSAACVSMKLISVYRPRYLFMTGVCATLSDDVQLGDIVIADNCWDWGAGKWATQDERTQFLPASTRHELDVDLNIAIKKAASDTTVLDSIRRGWHEPPPTVLSVHRGPFVSGASVVANEELRAIVLKQHRKVLGLDMEAFALFEAARQARPARPIALVAKGVMDKAGTAKDDKWKPYAAFVSARFVTHVVNHFLFD